MGALIEAARALSTVVVAEEILKLDFRNKKLLVSECKKGYCVAALVDRAEDYVDTLLRVIAERIDASPIAVADGCVSDEHKAIVGQILDTYVVYEIDSTLESVMREVYEPLVSALQHHPTYSAHLSGHDNTQEESTEHWEQVVHDCVASIEHAVAYARTGQFEKTCAACMSLGGRWVRAAIGAGLLARNMTKTATPPVEVLDGLLDSLDDDSPLDDLARAAVGRLTGKTAPIDYAHSYRYAAENFQFHSEGGNVLDALLLASTYAARVPEFASRLVEFFRTHNMEIVAESITAAVDRNRLFNEIVYSITSYDGFREELERRRAQVTTAIGRIESALDVVASGDTSGRARVPALMGTLHLQNYITLMTAMAESPVLSAAERKRTLANVIKTYRQYFRPLLDVDLPLFTFTVNSVFQSMAVAMAEYYHLTTGEGRDLILADMADFLQSIYSLVKHGAPHIGEQLSLGVITTAVSPVLTMAGELHHAEVRLVLTAIGHQSVRDIDAQRLLDPRSFATNFANTLVTTASLSAKVLRGDTRDRVLSRAVWDILKTHCFFVTIGIVIRDDIMSATYLAAEAVDGFEESRLREVVDIVCMLNRVAVQNPAKYDYEVAVMAYPYLHFLVNAWKRLGDEDILNEAQGVMTTAVCAWRKYGFEEKAAELEGEFGRAITPYGGGTQSHVY